MKYVSLLKFLCMFDIGQLEIYDMIGQAICNSRRAGGEVRSTSLLHSTLVTSKLCSCLVAYKISMSMFFFSAFFLFIRLIYQKLPFSTALSELPAARCLVLVKQPFPHIEPQSYCLG